MILKKLNGAIRKLDGAVRVKLATPAGHIALMVQKTPLIESLREVYGDPTAETHMFINDDGYLTKTDEGDALAEEVRQHYRYEGSGEPDAGVEDDELLGEEEADEDESLAAMTNAASEDDDLDDLLG